MLGSLRAQCTSLFFRRRTPRLGCSARFRGGTHCRKVLRTRRGERNEDAEEQPEARRVTNQVPDHQVCLRLSGTSRPGQDRTVSASAAMTHRHAPRASTRRSPCCSALEMRWYALKRPTKNTVASACSCRSGRAELRNAQVVRGEVGFLGR